MVKNHGPLVAILGIVSLLAGLYVFIPWGVDDNQSGGRVTNRLGWTIPYESTALGVLFTVVFAVVVGVAGHYILVLVETYLRRKRNH